jgi:hypothetical protein
LPGKPGRLALAVFVEPASRLIADCALRHCRLSEVLATWALDPE